MHSNRLWTTKLWLWELESIPFSSLKVVYFQNLWSAFWGMIYDSIFVLIADLFLQRHYAPERLENWKIKIAEFIMWILSPRPGKHHKAIVRFYFRSDLTEWFWLQAR
jgi:hypothetical protein